jgi:hypothetical protein
VRGRIAGGAEGPPLRVQKRGRSAGGLKHPPLQVRRYAVRGVGLGSLVPQWAQFCQRSSTASPQFGHVGFTEVPQFGQKANFAITFVLQCGQVVGRRSRRMK